MRTAIFFLLVIFLAARANAGSRRYPLSEYYDVEVDGAPSAERYELIVTEPLTLAEWLGPTPAPERRRNLLLNYDDTRQILFFTARNIESAYLRSETFNHATGRAMFDSLDLHTQIDGKLFIVARASNAFHTYWTLEMSPADAGGTLSEKRLRKHGIASPWPNIEPVLDRAAVTFIPQSGPPHIDEEISALLGSVPLVIGGRVEAKLASYPNLSPIHPAAFAHSAAISHYATLFTRIPIPEHLRPKPLSEKLFRRIAAARARFPEIPEVFLHPERQVYTVASHVAILAASEVLMKRYAGWYGFRAGSFHPVWDPDLQRTAYLGEVERSVFERFGRRRLCEWSGEKLISDGNVQKHRGVRPALLGQCWQLTLGRALLNSHVLGTFSEEIWQAAGMKGPCPEHLRE